MDIHQWLGTILGAISFISGVIFWYRGSVEKSYAAQRDFQHLKRSQEQQAENLELIVDETDEIAALVQANNALLKDLVHQIDGLNKTLIKQESLLIVMAKFPRDSEHN